MSEIINFPTKHIQDKASWKKSMVDVLTLIKKNTHIPEKLEQEILKLMIDVCMENKTSFQFNLEIPKSVSIENKKVIELSFRDTLKDFDKSITQFSQEALVKRLELEVRLHIHLNNQ